MIVWYFLTRLTSPLLTTKYDVQFYTSRRILFASFLTFQSYQPLPRPLEEGIAFAPLSQHVRVVDSLVGHVPV
ncbi:hypothetical protein KC363_g149 [Hortaea werneckii]|nr:hypothetical protein KC363_g149 [Hortaea werneckii]